MVRARTQETEVSFPSCITCITCIRGYHVYHTQWKATVGEILAVEENPATLKTDMLFVY